jgi:flagellin
MSFSIQTNVNSLQGQENLRLNQVFQGRTISRLTSGYRINSSADDAAGLAVANKFRSDIAELQQGVRNANDGVGQLQIIDGGLNNIAKILDRMKTLATQSASTTFTGERGTLQTEFSTLISEIDRQAANIQLDSGGRYNQRISVYVGGAASSADSNSSVVIDLSSTTSSVDASSLSLSNASVQGGGNQVAGAGAKDLSAVTTVLAAGGSQAFSVRYVNDSGADTTATVTVQSVSGGISLDNALGQINDQLSGLGISASVNSETGYLQFSGTRAFSITATGAAVGDGLLGNAGAVTVDNASLYTVTGANPTGASATEQFSLVVGTQTVQFTFGSQATAAAKVSAINAVSRALGITASVNSAGNVQLSSSSAFTMVKTVADGTGTNNTFGAAVGNITVTAPTDGTSETGNATSALSAIQAAVEYLGQVQGKVGAGQNKLAYAISLAQSQIANFSAAESSIRDADIAQEAANLTKAQVLQQASMAALAQANSAPQAVMALLRG